MSAKEDYLTEDTPVDNKKYCCISVVSPEGPQKCDKMCVIIRGAYETYEEAVERVNYLQGKRNNKYHVWVGQIGYWLPICFDSSIKPEEQIDLLNSEMKNKIKQKIEADLNYKNRKDTMKEKMIDEQLEVQKQNELLLENQEEQSDDTSSTPVASEAAPAATEETADTESTEVTEAAPAATEVVTPAATEVVTPDTNLTEQPSDDVEANVLSDNMKKCDIKQDSKLNYENQLTNDNPIKNQTWCCISFLTPQNSKVYGFKVRGVFATSEEASDLAKRLQQSDIYNHIYVASVSNWLEWEPDPDKIEDQVYENEMLNSIFKNKSLNAKDLDMFNQKLQQEEIENNLKKEIEESSKNQKEIIDKIFE
tara:strand:- start:1578 stop:2672 length:1095 start_codon:yes stop_codon:yes gene_type:complete